MNLKKKRQIYIASLTVTIFFILLSLATYHQFQYTKQYNKYQMALIEYDDASEYFDYQSRVIQTQYTIMNDSLKWEQQYSQLENLSSSSEQYKDIEEGHLNYTIAFSLYTNATTQLQIAQTKMNTAFSDIQIAMIEMDSLQSRIFIEFIASFIVLLFGSIIIITIKIRSVN